EHQAEGERGLTVLADADRMRELRQPRANALDRGRFERSKRGVERIVRFAELGRELQEPRESVRTLEARAAGGVEVRDFLRDVRWRDALAQGRARFRRE